ncbi:hypothetical protein Nepgr_003480 [Nepenthes gracilis]|uniref:Uncharacterized protein n=1 Tax=Nepenthes gracilis TaxID=150966 RepID=A0AAD3RZL0_NEPGR|nr:hypothetical protein Nepgr_003480 [Nepenthes gracilis]
MGCASVGTASSLSAAQNKQNTSDVHLRLERREDELPMGGGILEEGKDRGRGNISALQQSDATRFEENE